MTGVFIFTAQALLYLILRDRVDPKHHPRLIAGFALFSVAVTATYLFLRSA